MHARDSRPARLLGTGLLLGGLIVPALARAQLTSGPTVSAAPGQLYPLRYINGALQNVRPENLNPRGINYSDCASDMTLRYSVGVSGFTGQQLQVWISASSDCTMDSNRGNGLNPSCWNVANTTVNKTAYTTVQLDVPVRAIVGPLGKVPSPTGLIGDQPISACLSQTSPSPVQFTVFILPVQSPANYVGTGFMQVLPVDMVGPPAPTMNAPQVGDTFVQANWTPNADADTVGYDVFFEKVGSISAAAADASMTVLVCADSGSSTPVDAAVDDGGDGGDDASSAALDATVVADASCHLMNVGASPTAVSSCGMSTALSSSVASDAGTSSLTTASTQDGAVADAATTFTGPGGVATILCDNLTGASCPSGQPAYTATSVSLSGEGANSFNITGLTNGVNYNFVVSAVDAFGNPGPPSSPVQCGQPALVNDFFTLYRTDGGRAGGGFCALDVVGERSETSLGLAAVGLGAALFARRRRRPS
jgi:hypothetical protein